ncbi:hypothetical protein HN51_019784 [Arachis hypogaea]|uniref:BURP domain-containing protein n=2 Tax=Arachis TaxID=3817 RepID=A0A445BY93_ARAHY|nr:BURP domain protein RD22 [Arachis duranensis]XP_025614769.1 BURP domain protein RD22 [Arachis hypogaea]QHO31602.1 Dehydration-responsive protein [Arachis hypogaea]RYR43697.1 hypothetical protein Ahy_A08g040101 [Arachis hypogaea]
MESGHCGLISALFCVAFLLGSHVQANEMLWGNPDHMPKALRDLTKPGIGDRGLKISNNKIDVDVYGKLRDPNGLKDTVLNVTFFLEQDLHPGKKLKLEFPKRSSDFTFLPNSLAKITPFSSTRLLEILKRFGIEAESTDAKTVKDTLELCESPAIKGEEKYCATSLDSLVNFAVLKLGKNIKLLSTELEKENEKAEEYSVLKGVTKNGDKAVVCHKLNYPYAVFYCHKVESRAYNVPLVSIEDGTKAKALAICHNNTRHWASDNPAFMQLNVKPGTVPVCHFLATDTLLWVPGSY